MVWFHRAVCVVLLGLCLAQAVLVLLAYLRNTHWELLLYAVSSIACGVIQAPCCFLTTSVPLTAAVVSSLAYLEMFSSAIVLVVENSTGNHLQFPDHASPVVMALALCSTLLSGVSIALFWSGGSEPETVEDIESSVTEANSEQLSLNKMHLTSPPALHYEPMLTKKDSEGTLVQPAVHSEAEDHSFNWLIQASMTPSPLYENSSESWMGPPVGFQNSFGRSNTTGQILMPKVRQKRWNSFDLGITKLAASPIAEQSNEESCDHLPQLTDTAAMDGLEDIPRSAPAWGTNQHTSGIRNVSLQEWEAHKDTWLGQDGPGRPIVFSSSDSALRTSFSAPSLHTYRQASECSRPSSSPYSSLENTLARIVTPTQQLYPLTGPSSASSSPRRKMFGMFRRRDSESEPQYSHHKHSSSNAHSMANSMATMGSHPVSVVSGKSSRSGSPRKAIKSLFRLLISEFPAKRLSFSYAATLPQKPPLSFHAAHKSISLTPSTIPLSMIPPFPTERFWDETDYLEGSRVSSVPSAVIGEYDKEKWRTLKELKRQSEV